MYTEQTQKVRILSKIYYHLPIKPLFHGLDLNKTCIMKSIWHGLTRYMYLQIKSCECIKGDTNSKLLTIILSRKLSQKGVQHLCCTCTCVCMYVNFSLLSKITKNSRILVYETPYTL